MGAAWALALRSTGVTLAGVDAALGEGRVLRTHVLRPTWHLVAPEDLRWMLALTGPRLKRLLSTYDARFELDAALYRRARAVFVRTLEDRVAGAHFLLSNYDEYFIAYRHRDAVLERTRARNVGVWTTAEYPHQIVLHGRVAGSWRRELAPKRATITLKTYTVPAAAELRALTAAAARFGRFLGLPCDVRH